ncbi:hypothetical protein ACVIGB_000660 [Bradyrhizobium sp. USDA 4341]
MSLMQEKSPASITALRILWWLAHGGEPPYWDTAGQPAWRSTHHSTCCPHGLGEPFLPRSTVVRMLAAGLIELEAETYPAHIVAFPDPTWTQHQRHEHACRRQTGQPTMRPLQRTLLLTEKGRALAPESPPYPWRPAANGLSDITKDEVERLQKATVYATFQLAGALQSDAHKTPRQMPTPTNVAENVIPFVRGRHG